MADSPVFEWTAGALERATTFNSLQARGTVRLALKKAGLEAETVDIEGMTAVLNRVMPRELVKRNIADGETVCAALVSALRVANITAAAPIDKSSSPEDVFRRMFSNTSTPTKD
jgi:hypothetical protein